MEKHENTDWCIGMGREAAHFATMAGDCGWDRARDPEQCWDLLAGNILNAFDVNSRDRLVQAVMEYIRDLTVDPEKLWPDDEFGDGEAETDRRAAAREWCQELKDAVEEDREAVSAGVEAWVDEWIDGNGLDPQTLEEQEDDNVEETP